MKGIRWLMVISALAAAALLMVPKVQAGPFGLQGDDVPDAVLAGMRGRFVDGRQVSFFGVVMATSWQRSGQDFNMEMRMDIDMSRQGFRPNIRMYRTRNLGAPNAGSGNQVLAGVSDNGALEDISGVVQNIQVAGDDNGVHNRVNWNISDVDQSADPVSTDLVELNAAGTEAFENDAGVMTQVVVDDAGIGYQVDVPDVGTVAQRITRRQLLSAGNILQSTQLDSNLNQILNTIGLNVELAPAGNIPVMSRHFHRALNNLQGL